MSEEKTITEVSEFLGKPVFNIFKVKDGVKSQRPIISFGKSKAIAILNHVEEIKNFLNEGKNGDK